MVDLKLDFDEGIVLQTTEIGRCCPKEISIDELYLTNKNIICIYKKSNGLFAKADIITEKVPLTSIKVVNGKAQVMKVDDDDYEVVLQILFNDGHRELFIFYDDRNDQMLNQWHTAIVHAVTGTDSALGATTENTVAAPSVPPVPQEVIAPKVEPVSPPVPPVVEEEKSEKAFAGAALFAGFKGVMDAAKQTFAEVSQTVTEKVAPIVDNTQVAAEPIPAQAPQPIAQTEEKKEGKFMFCSNCGTKLNEGAKFCHGCGSAVGTVTPPAPPVPPVVEQPVQPKPQERQQEYIGKILKCPHCGSPINERTVICPDCGMEITGRSAVSSVQAFKEQLMAIETSRKGGLGGVLGVYMAANKADVQKLSLIRNFPIPNSIDDILEFMMLAIANIDVSLSKNTVMNRWNNTQQMETGATIGRTISNAWVSKMQQAYQKAEILFPDAPAFKGIQKLYFDKMKELKIKV